MPKGRPATPPGIARRPSGKPLPPGLAKRLANTPVKKEKKNA